MELFQDGLHLQDFSISEKLVLPKLNSFKRILVEELAIVDDKMILTLTSSTLVLRDNSIQITTFYYCHVQSTTYKFPQQSCVIIVEQAKPIS